jgi:hypothetical protein
MSPRIVCGGKWTIDGRWVVVAPWHGRERIVFDPGNGDPWIDLWDCLDYTKAGP